jgi:hypothetical protein
MLHCQQLHEVVQVAQYNLTTFLHKELMAGWWNYKMKHVATKTALIKETFSELVSRVSHLLL